MRKYWLAICSVIVFGLGGAFFANAQVTNNLWTQIGAFLRPVNPQLGIQIGISQQASIDKNGNATASQISISNLSSGNCVQASGGGELTTVAAPCGSTTNIFTTSYPYLQVNQSGSSATLTLASVLSLANNSSPGGINFTSATGTGIQGGLNSLALSQFTGILSVANGGTATNTLASLTSNSSPNLTVTGGQNVLIGTSTSISLGTNVVAILATGTIGSVFNGSIGSNTLTLNLPFASAINTGQLQSSDWTIFNNKLGSYNVISANGLISVSTTTALATLTASTSPTFTNGAFNGTLNVTGHSTLGNASATTLSLSGNLFVTGNSILANASSTNLDVNGNINLPYTTSVVGNLYFNESSFLINNSGGDLFLGAGAGNYTVNNGGNGANLGIGANSGNALSSGYLNALFGPNAGAKLTSGNNNLLVGGNSGFFMTSQIGNIAIGPYAMELPQSSIADYNICLGLDCLLEVQGSSNIAIGATSGELLGTGQSNTLLGGGTGQNITSGNDNLVLGEQVGNVKLGSGSNNILIGTDASTDVPTTTTANFLDIGNVIFGSNLYNQSNTSGKNLIGINSSTPGSNFVVQGTSTAATVPLFTIASSTGTKLLTVLPNGNTGIGTSTPSYVFVNSGTAQFYNIANAASGLSGYACFDSANQLVDDSAVCITVSAQRYKKDIKALDSDLSELMALNPVSFYYKPDAPGHSTSTNFTGLQYGLIAEQVQKVDPRLVVVNNVSTVFEGKTYASGTVEGLADINNWIGRFTAWMQAMEKQILQIITKLNSQQAEINRQQAEINHLQAEFYTLNKR